MTIYTEKNIRDSDGSEVTITSLTRVVFEGAALNVYNNLADSNDTGNLWVTQPFNPVPLSVIDSDAGSDSEGNPIMRLIHHTPWESEEEAINWWNQQRGI